MSYKIDGADLSWPSAEELKKCEEIRKNCAAEMAALPEQPRDVVGDVRVCRYLRFYSGDVAKASTAFAKFLQYRIDEKIDALRKGIIDLNLKDFTKWLESVMSPYTPHFVPGFTETEDGHFVIFTSPGSFKPNEFVSKRPACHTLDNDLHLVRVSLEYFMKQVDDNCYRRHKMCYAIKLIDCKELGNETLPVFVPEIRKFAQDNLGKVMSFYCEQDILLLVVNAPFMVRAITAFATTFMAKRQSNRIKVMGTATYSDVQNVLRAIGPKSIFPESCGGTRKAEDLPFYKPLLYQDENRVKQWMARTTAGITKDGATPMPTPSAEPEPVGEAPEAAPKEEPAEPAEAPEEEPLPVVNLEEEDLEKKSEMKVDIQEGPPPSSSWFCSCAAPCAA